MDQARPATAAGSRSRSSTSTNSGRINEAEGHVGGDRVLVGIAGAHRRPAPHRPGLPDRWRRVRGPAARCRCRGGYLVVRRILATALERRRHGPASRTSADVRGLVVHGRHRERPRHRLATARRSTARPRPRCCTARGTAGRASSSTSRERHSSGAIDRPGRRARGARSHGSRQPVRRSRSSSRSSTSGRATRAGSRAWSGRCPDRGSPIPRAVLRGGGRRADRRAGPRQPDRPRSPRSPAGPARQPDPQHLAADPGVGRVQRPRPGQAAPAPRCRAGRIVLELTEREAVEEMDQLIRAVEACRAAGMRIAADDVGRGQRRASPAGAAPVRHRQDRPLARPGWRGPGHVPGDRPNAQGPRRPLGRAGHRRGRRDRGAAGVRPLAGHPRRPGLPAGAADRTAVDRAGRPRCARPARARLAQATISGRCPA